MVSPCEKKEDIKEIKDDVKEIKSMMHSYHITQSNMQKDIALHKSIWKALGSSVLGLIFWVFKGKINL